MKPLAHHCYAAITGALLLLATGSTFAAHESNNYALLSSADSSAEGQALINYVAGKETWNGNVHVTGLPEGTYFYAVRLNAGSPQEVCMFTVNSLGNGSCSNGKFDLTGFNQALILDASGKIVLTGLFERRGGNREK